jgi:tRNA nucleotidyltransferase/poly(A) polymerase
MTKTPPSLAGAEWLHRPEVAALFALLNRDGEEARVAGGAVRDALMGRPVKEIDFATTATPDVVEARAAVAGTKTVPTGREHGTITVICHGHPFEVTTLREDVETDGRRAIVRFGRSWEHDARRRDFTINALFAGRDGTVHDPVGGYGDILDRRVRFIGNADQRIAEDRLRILRFFRFHAQLGSGAPDAEGLSASTRARNTIRELSAERVGQEMRKLVVAPGAAGAVEIMQDAGVLGVVLSGVGDVARFRRVAELESAWGVTPTPALRLTALGCFIEEDVDRIAVHLRLSNQERGRMEKAFAAARIVRPQLDEKAARAALYRVGPDGFRDGLLLSTAKYRGTEEAGRHLFGLPERWTPPAFPVGGADVAALGVPPGPQIGEALRNLEHWWIDRDFQPGLEALKNQLRLLVAGR